MKKLKRLSLNCKKCLHDYIRAPEAGKIVSVRGILQNLKVCKTVFINDLSLYPCNSRNFLKLHFCFQFSWLLLFLHIIKAFMIRSQRFTCLLRRVFFVFISTHFHKKTAVMSSHLIYNSWPVCHTSRTSLWNILNSFKCMTLSK